MLRSFPLALVFMTFDLSRSAFTSLCLPRTVYPLGLLLSSAISLAVAELWIHRSRGVQSADSHHVRTRSARTVFHLLAPGSSIRNHVRPG